MKTLNKLGYTKVELLIVVVLVGIVTFIMVNKTSYAFAIDNTETINDIKNIIEIQAEDYAMDHLEIFSEVDSTYINVDDLVENGYMIGNNKGLIIDPSDNKTTLNELKIRLDYNKAANQVEATLMNY